MSKRTDTPQGNNGCIWSRYRRKIKGIGGRDGGGKQMKLRATFATVTDMERGAKPAPPGMLPQLRVQIPRTKRQRYHLGSPRLG